MKLEKLWMKLEKLRMTTYGFRIENLIYQIS